MLSLWDLTTFIVLLAQEEEAPAANPMGQLLLIMVPAVIIMLILQTVLLPNQAKEKKKRDELIGSLKKNDPIVTIGGILGTFISASEDKTEVTIKVDDNTRLKVQANAIREVLVKKDDSEAKKA